MNNCEIFRVGYTATSGNQVEVCFTINKNAKILNEHFPGFPIVPGACTVGFVTESVVNMQITTLDSISIQRVAFLSPITPGLELKLVIEKKVGSSSFYQEGFDFKILRGAIIFCRGVITVGVDI